MALLGHLVGLTNDEIGKEAANVEKGEDRCQYFTLFLWWRCVHDFKKGYSILEKF